MKTIKYITAALALVAAGSTFAADVTLNFSGTLILPTCSVTTGTANQTIPLGTARTTDFAAVGSTQNPAAFEIDLQSCTSGTNVTMTVSGTQVGANVGVLASTGSAAGVGVQLLTTATVGATTGTPLALNSAISRGAISGTTMTIPLAAQMYRTGTMSAGNIAAIATVNFTYN